MLQFKVPDLWEFPSKKLKIPYRRKRVGAQRKVQAGVTETHRGVYTPLGAKRTTQIPGF